MKRVIYIILGILGAGLLIGAGIYLRLRMTKTPEVTATPGTSGGLPSGSGAFPVGTSEEPGSENGATTRIVQSQAIDYFPKENGDMLYIKTDGQIISFSTASSVILSARKFSDILDGTFSFDGKKVLVKYGEGSSPHWSVYDVLKNSWRDLPIEARDLRWAPKDERVAYFSRQISGQTLTIWDLRNEANRPRNILKINAEDMDVAWAGSNRLLFGERASAAVVGSLWSFDLINNTLGRFINEGLGLSVLWGNNTEGLIFNAKPSKKGGVLTLVNKDINDSSETLSFLTLPEKCAFFSVSTSTAENLICAIPRNTRTASQAALPDDYQKRLLVTEDNIYTVSITTGSFAPVLDDPDQKIDATHLKVAGQKVYFINRVDRRIYSASLVK